MTFRSCAALLCVFTAAPLAAQDAGAVVGASVGVSAIAGRSELTFSGSGGYRFNRYVALEVETTAVPTLKGAFPTDGAVVQEAATGFSSSAVIVPGIFPGPSYSNQNGRAVIFTNNVRVEMPTAADRLTPFFVAGGGVASVRRTADFTLPIGILQPLTVGIGANPGIRPITEHLTSSSTDLALTIGGGIAVRVVSHTTIDGDLRFYRLMGSSDTNVGRFTVGVRYRFQS